MATLPPAIRDLSYEEKCDLIDALWVDIASKPSPLSEAQLHELDRRLLHYQQNPSEAMPWAQVKAKLLKH